MRVFYRRKKRFNTKGTKKHFEPISKVLFHPDTRDSRGTQAFAPPFGGAKEISFVCIMKYNIINIVNKLHFKEV